MISYLRREWQSFGETVTLANTFNSEQTPNKTDNEKPVKAGDRYCYVGERNRTKYYGEARGFSLGQPNMRVDTTEFITYTGEVQNGITYVNQAPSCATILYIEFTASQDASMDNEPLTSFSVEAVKCEYQNGVSEMTVYTDATSLDPPRQKILLYGFTLGGVRGLTGGSVSVVIRAVPEVTRANMIIASTADECFTWNDSCVQSRKMGNDARLIIYEQEDGFWKIITETIWIKLKPYFRAYGTMGGAFKNWLVDSGFEKYQHDYTYEREGVTINAHTITYANPTGKAGYRQDWRPATDYNGEITVLQPGDTFTVWYYEDVWQINQAIYAKNFQSDSQAAGQLQNVGNLKFKMNYIPAFASIKNKPGKVDYMYLNGGFAQVDTVGYTGMAIILNFICTGKKFYTSDNNTHVDAAISPYISYIGDDYRLSGGTLYRQGCCSGFAAGYDDVVPEHDMTISYTVMKPSDPDFVTGGESYGESITSDLEVSIRNLQDQINSILAEMNIQQVTSAVFTAITNLGELPGLFSNITKVFSKAKDALSKLKKRKGSPPSPIAATSIVDRVTADVPNVTIVNKMPEEYELGIIYNSIRAKKLLAERKHDFGAFAIATETKLPYIVKASSLPRNHIEVVKSKGISISGSDIVQFDPMRSVLSTMKRKNAEIINYKIDPELAHEVLSQMSTTATRSLFSLNVRKQIHLNNSFTSPTYGQLVDRILDDGELLDILGKLNQNTVGELFQEFFERIQSMLREY